MFCFVLFQVAYKLVYFPVRGRGQPIRYLAADQGIEMLEEIIPLDGWEPYKDKQPFGQLPVLYDGDLELAQANAILRHIARKHGLYGRSEREKALIDMVNDQQQDIRESYYKMINDSDFEKAKAIYIENLPNLLASLEIYLGKNNGGSAFFVGDQISFVDYTVFDLLDCFLVLSSDGLNSVPLLREFHSRMASREKIAELRATEAFQKMTICGNGKQ